MDVTISNNEPIKDENDNNNNNENNANDEITELAEALKPQNTFNPVLQRFYQNLQARALDPECEIQELDPVIMKYLEVPDELFQKNTAYIQKYD